MFCGKWHETDASLRVDTCSKRNGVLSGDVTAAQWRRQSIS